MTRLFLAAAAVVALGAAAAVAYLALTYIGIFTTITGILSGGN